MSDIDYSIQYRRWNDTTAEFFEAQAKGFEGWLAPGLSRLPKDACVLDYGCGFGVLSHYLKRRFDNVLSVDSSPEQIAVALQRGLNAAVVAIPEFDEWVERQRNKFDVVFLFDVLEHIPVDLQITFARKLVSTLKTDGQLFVKVPNANSLIASRWRYIDWTHTSSFTEASLDFVFLNSGMEQPVYLRDDSSARPRMPWLLRPSLGRYYLRGFLRSLWKLYLRAELGPQARHITVGYNLFARTRRLK